jgi:hypothetical protein
MVQYLHSRFAKRWTMDQTRKAFIVFAAAISAGNLAACNSDDDSDDTADAAADTAADHVAVAPAADAEEGKDRVVLQEDASRPAQNDAFLAMPAGTIYDVLMKEDFA